MRVLPFGERALLLDLELDASPERAARVRAAAAWARGRAPGLDVAVGQGALLLSGLDAWTDPGPLLAEIAAEAARPPPPPEAAPPLLVGVVYDGPDLDAVAQAVGASPADIVKLHTSAGYTVELLGFLPGFGYLGPAPEALSLPRRATPRPAVPARSVAVAAGFTGIYPSASPGGWHLLGRAPFFEPFRPGDQRPELAPGRRVRFASIEAPPAAAPAPRAALAAEAPALRIVAAPACATVQDGGRGGQLFWGLPPSGALDPSALAAANLAVGNPTSAAAVEIPLGTLEVQALGEVEVSVDGEAPRRLADGERWRVPAGERAVRYLAAAGGVETEVVLGSRSSLPTARLCGGPLRRGDALPVGPRRGGGRRAGPSPGPPPDPALLHLIPGPHLDHFGPDALDRLISNEYTVSRLLDRVGTRLEGPALPSRGRLAGPVPMLRGAVEVAADGAPIVLGPDHPVTGGYPVLGALTQASQALLARLWPGRRVRFAVV